MTGFDGVPWRSTRHRSAPVGGRPRSDHCRPPPPPPARRRPRTRTTEPAPAHPLATARHPSRRPGPRARWRFGRPRCQSSRAAPACPRATVDGRRPQRRPRDDVRRPDLARRAGNREDPPVGRRSGRHVRPQTDPPALLPGGHVQRQRRRALHRRRRRRLPRIRLGRHRRRSRSPSRESSCQARSSAPTHRPRRRTTRPPTPPPPPPPPPRARSPSCHRSCTANRDSASGLSLALRSSHVSLRILQPGVTQWEGRLSCSP